MVRQSRPTKAFDADSDLEFDFFLAEKLGMTVERMRASVSADEWLRWAIYYGRKAQRRHLEIEEMRRGKRH